jgi:hypothetical protein
VRELVDALGELVQAEQRPPEGEDHVPEGAGVLVEHGVGPDQRPVERDADLEVADGQGDVGEGTQGRHGDPVGFGVRAGHLVLLLRVTAGRSGLSVTAEPFAGCLPRFFRRQAGRGRPGKNAGTEAS